MWDENIIENRIQNCICQDRKKRRSERISRRKMDLSWSIIWTGISKTMIGSTTTRQKMSESQWRDQDWKCLSLNNKTEIETENVWVSMTSQRPRLKKFESEWRETRLGKRCRYWDLIKTLVDIRPSTCHEMTSVWKGSSDICQIFFVQRLRSEPWTYKSKVFFSFCLSFCIQ